MTKRGREFWLDVALQVHPEWTLKQFEEAWQGYIKFLEQEFPKRPLACGSW